VQPKTSSAVQRRRLSRPIEDAAQRIQEEPARIHPAVRQQDERRERADLGSERGELRLRALHEVDRQRRVGVQQQHPGRARARQRQVLTAAEAEVPIGAHERARKPLGESAFDRRRRLVPRRVVHHHDLEIPHGLRGETRETGRDRCRRCSR
jgi:hypothetical protein